MPAVSLQTLNTLNTAIVPAGASVASDGGGFRSLLDIGTAISGDSEAPKEYPRKDAKPVDAQAAAIDAPEASPDRNLPPRADGEQERGRPSASEVHESDTSRRPVAQRSDDAKPIDRPLRPHKKLSRADQAKLQEASAQGKQQPVLEYIKAILAEIAALEEPASETGATPVLSSVQAVSLASVKLTPMPAVLPESSDPILNALPGVQFPIAAEASASRPIKKFLAQLENLIDRLEAFIADSATGKKPLSLTEQIHIALKTLRNIFKQVASGDIGVPEAMKKLKPVLAEIRKLFPKLAHAIPQALEKLPETRVEAVRIETARIETKPETTPQPIPGVRGFIERAEAVLNMPQVTVTATAHHSAIAASAENTGTDTGGHSGNSGGQNLPPSVAARAAGSDTSLKIAGGAEFARLVGRGEPRPVADQVMFHIRTALKDGSSNIRIQLEPAELGKLDIKLHVEAGGKTGVTITADNRNTLDLLQRDARGLERALSDAGLSMDSGSMSFNLKGGDQQRQDTALAAQTYQKIMPEAEAKPEAAITKSYVVNLAEGLDITI